MTETRKRAEPAKIRPRIGRWEQADDGTVTLLGSTCGRCGETFFPALAFCGRCGSAETAEARLTGPAKLFSFTIVHQLPSGFTGPLAVGYGQFADRVLVLAPIDAPHDQIEPGMPLDLHIGVTWIDDDGDPMESYRFRPAARGLDRRS